MHCVVQVVVRTVLGPFIGLAATFSYSSSVAVAAVLPATTDGAASTDAGVLSTFRIAMHYTSTTN